MNDFLKVRLVKSHKHNGEMLAPGAEIVLPARVADWLIEQGSAESTGIRSAEKARAAAPVRRASCCGRA